MDQTEKVLKGVRISAPNDEKNQRILLDAVVEHLSDPTFSEHAFNMNNFLQFLMDNNEKISFVIQMGYMSALNTLENGGIAPSKYPLMKNWCDLNKKRITNQLLRSPEVMAVSQQVLRICSRGKSNA